MAYDWWRDQLNKRIAVDYDNVLVHRGEMFFCSHTWDAHTSATTVGFVITTGTAEPHGIFSIDFGGSGEWRLYETPTSGVTIPGTALTEYNQNRTDSKLPTAACSYDPTVTDLGTVILEYGNAGGAGLFVGSGAGANNSGHWNLKSSTTYVVCIENNSGSTATNTVRFFWHE